MSQLPPDIDALEKLGYKLDEELTHADLVPFVVRYLKTSTSSSRFFFAFNIGAALILLSVCIYAMAFESMALGEVFLQFSYGCALTFLLVPIHEGLHGLAYKWCGAPTVTYEAHWKKLYFTANADKFVVGRKAFRLVGLAPFIVITTLLAVAASISSLPIAIMVLTILTVHAGMCAGDFGLLSYFDFRKPHEVVTFDDMKSGKSFFLIRSSEPAEY